MFDFSFRSPAWTSTSSLASALDSHLVPFLSPRALAARLIFSLPRWEEARYSGEARIGYVERSSCARIPRSFPRSTPSASKKHSLGSTTTAQPVSQHIQQRHVGKLYSGHIPTSSSSPESAYDQPTIRIMTDSIPSSCACPSSSNAFFLGSGLELLGVGMGWVDGEERLALGLFHFIDWTCRASYERKTRQCGFRVILYHAKPGFYVDWDWDWDVSSTCDSRHHGAPLLPSLFLPGIDQLGGSISCPAHAIFRFAGEGCDYRSFILHPSE